MLKIWPESSRKAIDRGILVSFIQKDLRRKSGYMNNMPWFLGNSSRCDNPQALAAGVVANSAVSEYPLIEIVAVGNSRGQARVFPDEANKINKRPIIVPNEFIMFFNFARPSFWGNSPAIAARSGVHKPETCRYSNHFLDHDTGDGHSTIWLFIYFGNTILGYLAKCKIKSKRQSESEPRK